MLEQWQAGSAWRLRGWWPRGSGGRRCGCLLATPGIASRGRSSPATGARSGKDNWIKYLYIFALDVKIICLKIIALKIYLHTSNYLFISLRRLWSRSSSRSSLTSSTPCRCPWCWSCCGCWWPGRSSARSPPDSASGPAAGQLAWPPRPARGWRGCWRPPTAAGSSTTCSRWPRGAGWPSCRCAAAPHS